jgi:hypothetical protein
MSALRIARLAAAALLLAGTTACGIFGRPAFGLGTTAEPAAADSVDVTLVLIGDAGQPHLPVEPVLVALEREIARDPEHTFVAFLGDNLYPVGLADTTAPSSTRCCAPAPAACSFPATTTGGPAAPRGGTAWCARSSS